LNQTDPRRHLLLTLFQAGLARTNGRRCVAAALKAANGVAPASVDVPRPGPVWVAAIGKAASAMALGAHDVLGNAIQRVLLITKEGHVDPQASALPAVEIYESAHPVPDQRSLAAGETLLRWVGELPDSVQPLFLISGGASSVVEVLHEGVSLEQLAQVNAEGHAGGIPIAELNARRARLSRIKGGGLTGILGGRSARALFISDVPDDDPAVIGSGLLGPAGAVPDSIERTVIASLDHAVDAVCAAAQQFGLDVRKASKRFDGDAVRLAVRFTHELHLNPAQVCVWGGESTVQLPEHPGRGGRNQHLALAAARLIAGQSHMTLLAAGTDGTDGPTEDAGALVDGETCARLMLAQVDVEDCMRRADAGTALALSGDLLHTGPTGTNVGDIVVGLKLSMAAASIVCGAEQGVGRTGDEGIGGDGGGARVL
jgi:hydroxypyruvate reductase